VGAPYRRPGLIEAELNLAGAVIASARHGRVLFRSAHGGRTDATPKARRGKAKIGANSARTALLPQNAF
jgi:hypothetical protein